MSTALLPFEESFRRWVENRGMRWERVEVAVDGSDITAGYRIGPREPRRTVVALHGAGNDALFAWVGLFKRLLQSGSRILTFDLPGHGRTSRTWFTPAAAASSLRAVLDLCSAEQPVHAVGVSLGGSVLLSSLPDVQSRLASATIVVAPLEIRLSVRSLLPEVGPRTFRILWREREDYGLTGLIPSFGSFKRDIYPLRLQKRPPGSFGYVDALNAMLHEMRLEERASRVSIPVLLAYGDRDRVVPVEQGEMLTDLMPRSEMIRIRGGTHLSTPLERTTMDRIERWIEAHDR